MERLKQIFSMRKGWLALAFTLVGFQASAAETASKSMFGASDELVFWMLVAVMGILFIVNIFLINAMKNLASNKGLWSRIMDKAPVVVLVAAGLLGSTAAQAADGVLDLEIVLTKSTFWTMVAIDGALFLLMLFLISTFKQMLNTISGKEVEEEELEEEGFVESITEVLTDRVSMEEEHTILMDHDYDGIRELDNNLPPWWKWGFYLTIVWAVVYLVHFHVMQTGDLQLDEYKTEMQEAAAAKEAYLARAKNLITENNVKQLTSETALANGEKFFKSNCAACHGQSGEGNAIGPNLTDEYWLHGGTVGEVFTTVKYGVPDKGMQSWKNEMGPGLMQDVVSYVLSLQGTNPPNGKAPQGTKMSAEPEPAADQMAAPEPEVEASDTTAVEES